MKQTFIERGGLAPEIIPLILLAILFLLTSCDNIDLFPTAENISATEETTVGTNETNTTNSTNSTIPEIIPYNENLVIYMTHSKNSIIVRYDNKTILIDAGSESDSQSLLQTLRNLGVGQIDRIILTNTNKKRIEAVPYIILKTNPTAIYDSGIRNENTKIYESVYNWSTTVMYDDYFIIDELMVYLLVPYDDGEGLRDNEDSNSIVVRLYYNGFSIMFMSDCDYDCEERIGAFDADILVTSENCESTSLLFLQKVEPEMVIMPVECGNIRTRINNLDIPLYPRVTIVSDGETYEVR